MADFSRRQTCQVLLFSPSRATPTATVPPLLSSKGTVTVLASTITMAFTDYRQSAGRVAATLFQYVVSGFYTLVMEIERNEKLEIYCCLKKTRGICAASVF